MQKVEQKIQIPVPRQMKREKKYSTAICLSHSDEDITKSQQHQVKRTLPWTMVSTKAV